MSFLAPWFLLGGLTIGLPIAFHLIRRSTRDQTLFSSLMFLRPSQPRLTRRSRLEHWLLLALRCLAVALLALGFSRPFWRDASAPAGGAAPGRRRLVLLDTSASMRRRGLWAEARSRAEAAARAAAAGDELQFMTFDRTAAPILTFGEWNAAPAGERAALVAGRLAAVEPGWSGTSLGDAVISAAEALADTDGSGGAAPAQRDILLLTDLQEGARLDGLQGFEWPKGIALSIEAVRSRRGANAGVQLAADETAGDSEAVRVRVSNAADSTREQFELGWARIDGGGIAGPPVNVYTPPGQSRIFALPPPPAGASADHIVLTGDDEDFDNHLFLARNEIPPVDVLYLGGESPSDPRQPLYFLIGAFSDSRRQAIRVTALAPDKPLPPGASQTALVVVTGLLSEAAALRLREQALAGKTVIVTPRDASAGPFLAALLGLERLAVEEAAGSQDAALAEIDYRHPLFAPFADPRYADFSKIRFWKHRRIDPTGIPGARVAARFDQGDAAVIDVPTGKGRVLILTSSWRPADSQWALSSKFVPWAYAALNLAGVPPPASAQYTIGDVIPLPNLKGPISVRLPGGALVDLPDGATNFAATVTPGIYAVKSGAESRRFGVNLDPAESRTAPMPTEGLERLGAPAPAGSPAATSARTGPARQTDQENRQKLWRWLLAATLLVLMGESGLAGRIARTPSSEAAA